jgi:hypothetical protein
MALLLRDTAGVKYYDKRPLNIHRPMLASYILWAFVMQEQEIVDVCLERVLTSEEWAQVKKAVMVAMWCTQDSSRLRPTMVTVVQMLEGVVEVKDPPLQYGFPCSACIASRGTKDSSPGQFPECSGSACIRCVN